MRLLLTLVVLLAVVSPAAAQTAASETVVAQAVEAVFNAIEKRLINDYFAKKAVKRGKVKIKPKKAGKSGSTPPGLAARKTLTPGHAKRLERKGTLPPGLAKRDLPPDLASLLPPVRPGHKRYVVGNDVVLIERATGLILDILFGVALND